MTYILALIFSAISSVCLLISTIAKDKTKLVLWQNFDTSCNCISCLLVGSFSGFTTSLTALIRNLLTLTNKMNTVFLCIILVANISLGIIFNAVGWIGWLPIIASTEYTLFVCLSKSVEVVRISLMINMALWIVHNFVVGLYPSAITLSAITLFDIGWLLYRWIVTRNKVEI